MDKLKKYFFVTFCLFSILLSGYTQGQYKVETIEKKYEPVQYGNQYIEGYLGHWIDNAIEDELFQFPIEDYVFPYYTGGITNGRWITGEFTGKYMHAMCLAYDYKYRKNTWKYKELKSRMDIILNAWLSFQSKHEGYAGIHISNDRKPWQDLWNVWHVKYVLLGLLKYYDLFGDPHALRGAIDLGNSFISEFGPEKRGFEGSELGPVFLESLALLYKHTGDKKYLDNCYWIMDHQVEPELVDLINKKDSMPHKHVYSMQSHLISALELYEIEGKKKKYLNACIQGVEIMANRKQFITGGFGNSEFFTTDHVFGPTSADHPQEACTAAHFMYLCRKLFYLTGDSKYIDHIEHTLYNAALTSKNPHNGFETNYYSPLQGIKEWKVTHHKNGTPCCSESITRELTWLPEMVWSKNKVNGFAVLLYNKGHFTDTIYTKEGKKHVVNARFETDFPASGTCQVSLQTDQPAVFAVHFRVPAWCNKYTLSINDKSYIGVPGTFLHIERKWVNNDVINITMDMPVKFLFGKSYAGYAAFKRGPQILAVDGYLNKDLKNLHDLRIDTSGAIELQEIPANKLPDQWWGKQLYSSSNLHDNEVYLVPYAEAGQIHHTLYHTWIRIKAADREIIDDGELRYTGDGWMIEQDTLGHFGGSIHSTQNKGDYMEYTFTGTGVELYACSWFNPWSPDKRRPCKVDIYLNSKYYGEFTSREQHMQRRIFHVNNLPEKKYKLRVVCKDEYAFVDYIRVCK